MKQSTIDFLDTAFSDGWYDNNTTFFQDMVDNEFHRLKMIPANGTCLEIEGEHPIMITPPEWWEHVLCFHYESDAEDVRDFVSLFWGESTANEMNL